MANVTVSSTIDTLLQSADAAEAKTAISAATAGSVSALSSNALVLAEKEWPIKTVTWATNQTLTYTGGTDTAGDGVIIQANVTAQFVLTVTPTSSTIYRNGAVTSLSGTITVPVGKHRFVFWTPDDGTTLYMEDTVFAAIDVPVSATPSNYTAATPDVEAHLAGIDTAIGSAKTVPAQSQSAAYTAVLSDSGKSIDHPSSDANARTFTIPANSSVAYPVGTCLSFSNMTSQVVTIAITTDTMYLAGTGTTGSRSLAQYGCATARKLTSTTWLISGTGLT